MYEEHEDGSFTLHMCEWYEQGRRLVGEYETLGDGSGFAVTDEWPAGLKVVVNHPLTRPDGTVMPGISRLRRFDWKVGPDEGLHADDYEIWGAGTARTSRTRPVRRRAAIPGSVGRRGIHLRPIAKTGPLPPRDNAGLHDVAGGQAFHAGKRDRSLTGDDRCRTIPMTPTIHSGHAGAVSVL